MVALKINTIQLSMLAVDKDFAEGSDNCHKFLGLFDITHCC